MSGSGIPRRQPHLRRECVRRCWAASMTGGRTRADSVRPGARLIDVHDHRRARGRVCGADHGSDRGHPDRLIRRIAAVHRRHRPTGAHCRTGVRVIGCFYPRCRAAARRGPLRLASASRPFDDQAGGHDDIRHRGGVPPHRSGHRTAGLPLPRADAHAPRARGRWRERDRRIVHLPARVQLPRAHRDRPGTVRTARFSPRTRRDRGPHGVRGRGPGDRTGPPALTLRGESRGS